MEGKGEPEAWQFGGACFSAASAMRSAAMAAHYVVKGQHVRKAKMERARVFRKEMTPAESRLWQAIRRQQLEGARFRRQQIIDGFIVDFYCPASALVVEVDGAAHDEQQEYDVARDQLLAARGIRIVRFSNNAVLNDLDRVLGRIRAAVHENPEAANY